MWGSIYIMASKMKGQKKRGLSHHFYTICQVEREGPLHGYLLNNRHI